MSPRDVNYYEMDDHRNIDERDVEALLAGRVSIDDPELGPLAELVRDVGRAFPESSVECLEQEHVRSMMAAVTTPVDAGANLSPSWNARLRMTLRAISASLAFKIVFGAVVAAMAVAGLRAAKETSRPDQDSSERRGVIGASIDDLRPMQAPPRDTADDANGADSGSTADPTPVKPTRPDADSAEGDESEDADDESSEADAEERDDESPEADEDEESDDGADPSDGEAGGESDDPAGADTEDADTSEEGD